MIILECLGLLLLMIHNRNTELISHIRKKVIYLGYHQLKEAKKQQGNLIDNIL